MLCKNNELGKFVLFPASGRMSDIGIGGMDSERHSQKRPQHTVRGGERKHDNGAAGTCRLRCPWRHPRTGIEGAREGDAGFGGWARREHRHAATRIPERSKKRPAGAEALSQSFCVVALIWRGWWCCVPMTGPRIEARPGGLWCIAPSDQAARGLSRAEMRCCALALLLRRLPFTGLRPYRQGQARNMRGGTRYPC